MSYLYNMYAGSLTDLKSRLDAVDLADPDAVKGAIKEHDQELYELVEDDEIVEGTRAPTLLRALVCGTWAMPHEERINWFDWHEESTFLDRAGTVLPERADYLLADLFQSPPLGITPSDWGFCGALTHAEVVELRDALAVLLPADTVEDARSNDGGSTPQDELAIELMLGWVYVSLLDVADGQDVAVSAGLSSTTESAF